MHTLTSKSCDGDKLTDRITKDEELGLSDDIEGDGLGNLASRVSCKGKICGNMLQVAGEVAARPKKPCKHCDTLGNESFLPLYFSTELAGDGISDDFGAADSAWS
jgi:hypothetical protein